MVTTEDNDRILVDYYAGGNGPTLRIGVSSREKLGKFREVFFSLAHAQRVEFELTGLPGVRHSASVSKVLLKRVSSDPTKCVRLVGSDPAVFEWSKSAEGWLECAELVDGLVGPGHQYLSRGSHDDALIELSFLETS